MGYRFHPEKYVARMLQNHEQKAIAAIRSHFELLETYEVPATRAFVGKLFFEHPDVVDNTAILSEQRYINA
jgi:hypothetical protein